VRAGPWEWGIIGLALALRLGLVAAALPEPARLSHEPDSSGYTRLAQNLREAARFSLDAGPPLRPDHTRTPLYPALLALLDGAGPLPAALLNAVAGAATVAALVLAGARLLGPAAARIAGAVVAADPTSSAYGTAVLTEAVFTLFLTLALLRLGDGLRTGGLASVARAGGWLGLATLTRPIGLYLPLLLGGTLLLRPDRAWRWVAAGSALLVAGTAALALPWAWRNAVTGGRFELSAIPAINLYYHRAAAVVAEAGATSREAARRELAARLEAEVRARNLTEAEGYTLMERWGRDLVAADPARYARLHAAGIVRMLAPDPEPVLERLGWLGPDRTPRPERQGTAAAAALAEGLFLAAVYGAALVGLGRAGRARALWLVAPAVAVVAYGILVAGPEVYPRFRVPLVPALGWLAGLGVAGVPRASRQAA
jgi:Dolichyl-phosphate-mannose-protein mannosyltransferase